MKNIGSVIFVLILIGCASQAPVPISKIPVGNVSVAEVRADTARFIDSEVRWSDH
jgi:hypothetical protein